MNHSMFRSPFGRWLVLAGVAICLALGSPPAQAQSDSGPDPAEKFTRQELAQMLAPIALYPDTLLSQILMASTYPIEVIEADRWLRQHSGLTGEPLDQALLAKGWDPSVKSLCHFPTVLARMSEHIAETTSLGNAFLAQEAEVMDMVQELRAKAYAEGNLTTTPQQKVVVEQETIYIEPADRRVVYVPYYDPFFIYGPWWYPAYPPYYWGPVGVRLGLGISFWPGIYFGFSFGEWCYFDWHHHYIYVDTHKRPRFVHHEHWFKSPGNWQHAPQHRKGVAYRDKFTAGRYGQTIHRPSEVWRDNRGFPERRDLLHDRNRNGEMRDRVGMEKPRDDNSRYDRYRQEQPRVERELKSRDRQKREQPDRDRQGPPAIERDRRVPGRSEPEQQARTEIGRVSQERQKVEQERQIRQRPVLENRARERVEREQRQRSRDNIFNAVDDGRQERRASERGRFIRQDRGGDSPGQVHPGGGSRRGFGQPGRDGH